MNGINSGATALLVVEERYLPGEFVLRFDYKESPASAPYPSEKRVMIGTQDLELWVNPKYCNDPDSTWFQPGETENSALSEFARESFEQKEQINLLQQFLADYDDTGSKLYRQCLREYEKRRLVYNEWLAGRKERDRDLFVSSLYSMQYIPETRWGGTEEERLTSIIDHYFDGADLSDPALTRTTALTGWIDAYVNLHGQMATTAALRDSLFPAAAGKAIEKAREGHPEVYGWMVDYFYRGFEINNIPAGMKALEPYLNDPDCLTSRRKEIARRLEGIETLVPGTKAPEIRLNSPDGVPFSLYGYKPSARYILLLFWSADCSHCREIMQSVYPLQQQPEIREKLSVVAVSLDETEPEIQLWQKAVQAYGDWIHLRTEDGVRSKVAADYYILSTPQMIVLDAGTREIIDLPGSAEDLRDIIQQKMLNDD